MTTVDVCARVCMWDGYPLEIRRSKFILQPGLASIYLNHLNPTLNKQTAVTFAAAVALNKGCMCVSECTLCMFGILRSTPHWTE